MIRFDNLQQSTLIALGLQSLREKQKRRENELRNRRNIDPSGSLLAGEENAILRQLGRELGIQLPTVPVVSWYEGTPHERDPEWPRMLEACFVQVCRRRIGCEALTLRQYAELNLQPPMHLFIEAEELAAAVMRRIARRAG